MTLLPLIMYFIVTSLSLRTNIDVFLSPNMILLSLNTLFAVPFLHPLEQIMSSLPTLMIIYDTSLTHYVFYSALPSPVTTNNVNFLDNNWNFPHPCTSFTVPFSHPLRQIMTSLSIFVIIYDTSLTHYVFYSALPSPVTTNDVNF
jgi:hypothetical protein